MGFDIQLNDPLLVQLYGKNLYKKADLEGDTKLQQPEEDPEKGSSINQEKIIPAATPVSEGRLGNFEKKVAVLVDEKQFPVIAEDDLAFLTKILDACHLGIKDVMILNIAGMDNIPGTMATLLPAKALLLGVEQEDLQLPLRFPHFQVQPFDQCVYLSAPPLKELAGSRELKAAFWNSLKRMFQL